MLKRFIVSFFITLCVFAVLFLWACGGIRFPGERKGVIYDFGKGPAPALADSKKITVLTWNISYAYGFGSSGKGYTPRTFEDIDSRLDRIGKIISDSNADIALLQEVDFNSRRSGRVNQMIKLSRITGLRYATPAVAWRAGYVPFPFWPLKNHFGAVLSGGVVLSRYPITAHRVILYPKPGKNHWWYNLFYLFRYSQEVRIERGKKEYLIINNHLEAFDKDNRMEQARSLSRMAAGLSNRGETVIIGGDFNALPPGASRRYEFSDGTKDDYRDDQTLDILLAMPGFKEVVPPERYLHNERDYFTFPAHAPNRRLDYLFLPKEVKVISVRIISSGSLSDHLPLLAELAS